MPNSRSARSRTAIGHLRHCDFRREIRDFFLQLRYARGRETGGKGCRPSGSEPNLRPPRRRPAPPIPALSAGGGPTGRLACVAGIPIARRARWPSRKSVSDAKSFRQRPETPQPPADARGHATRMTGSAACKTFGTAPATRGCRELPPRTRRAMRPLCRLGPVDSPAPAGKTSRGGTGASGRPSPDRSRRNGWCRAAGRRVRQGRR